MTDDVLLNKAATIERCIKRIREEYEDHKSTFITDYTRQDSVILNLQRACEACIDAAMHLIQIQKLGLPQSSREAFVLLKEAKIISTELGKELQAMVGLRNIAVHEYTKLDMDIVIAIIENHLKDFLAFTKILIQYAL
jgi:uncharacterized protein YutE (UPF0331/DUF86 family)